MLDDNSKYKVYKYLGLVALVMAAIFFAVYFAVNMALNSLFSPFRVMNNMDRELYKMEREMLPPPPHIGSHSIIHFVKTPDEYKFTINLKPLNNDVNNVNISTENNLITFSGEADIDKKYSESITKFSQTYALDDADFNNMSRRKVHNKYIITIPIAD